VDFATISEQALGLSDVHDGKTATSEGVGLLEIHQRTH
jgi:hypothetical protein